jgi:hypothetical protein
MHVQVLFASLARAWPRAGNTILEHLAGSLLGLGILGWAAVHSGPTRGEVVVHVTEPDVEVEVGGRTFRIEDRRHAPIVCELTPGWHDLVMRRRGRVLHEESFELRAGMSVVLTAWDPNRDRAGPDRRRPGGAAIIPWSG